MSVAYHVLENISSAEQSHPRSGRDDSMTVTLNTGSGTVAAPLAIRGDDLYETPPCAVRSLLAVEPIPLTVWEPACGPGSIVRELRATGRAVIASDLVEYGCEDSASRIDFLMEREAPAGVPAIVTNPPFKLAEEFAAKACELAPEVYMLLRLAFLEGLRWNERGLANGLARVWVFAPRLPFMHRDGYDGPRNSNSGMPFAWFVWRRDHVGSPTIGWLNWRAPT
jgi:hypothetical protein